MIKKIAIKSVETFLKKNLLKNKVSIGFDVSVHSTGIAILRTTEDYIIVEKTDKIITPNKIEQLSALDSFISQLDDFKNKTIQVHKINFCICEECYYSLNANVFKALARHSALVYDRFRNICDKVELLLATQARKRVGFGKSDKGVKGEDLKKEIIEFINAGLGLELKLKDNDVADALLLALAGITKE